MLTGDPPEHGHALACPEPPASPAGPAAYTATVTYRTAPSARLVALTIDDGPTGQWTPHVLRILQRRAAKAIFLMVGSRARADPAAVSRATDSGHEVANHTRAQSDLTQHGEALDRASLERTHELLTQLSGPAPTLCRPPYGRIDSVGLAVCPSLHHEVMLWSDRVTDSNARRRGRDPAARLPGSIVFAHDGSPQPNATLMRQLDRLAKSMTDAGYTFVTVSELLAAGGQGYADGVPGRPPADSRYCR
jgi:peptidoglycan/xylan/chitin deacetylase (PgdA/CDA1 family)